MRWLVLALAAVLALPAVAGAQEDWAQGLRGRRRGLREGQRRARRAEADRGPRRHAQAPKQARRATFSGVDIRPVHPGLLPGRRSPPARAATSRPRRSSKRVLTNKLVTPGDRKRVRARHVEPAAGARPRCARRRARAAGAKERQAETPRTTTTVPAGGNTGRSNLVDGPTRSPRQDTTPEQSRGRRDRDRHRARPPPPTEPAWLADFRRAMNASRASLQKARYSEARSSLAAATPIAGDAARRQEADGARARDRLGAEHRRAAGRGARASGDPAKGRHRGDVGGGVAARPVARARGDRGADARHRLAGRRSRPDGQAGQRRTDRREAVPLGPVQGRRPTSSSRPSTRA